MCNKGGKLYRQMSLKDEEQKSGIFAGILTQESFGPISKEKRRRKGGNNQHVSFRAANGRFPEVTELAILLSHL